MGTVLIKLKIMPTSPEADLKEIEKHAKSIIKKNKGKNLSFEIQPIAFGLKAIIASFALDESDELEPTEIAIKKIENVNSVEVVDMRKAFG